MKNFSKNHLINKDKNKIIIKLMKILNFVKKSRILKRKTG